MDFGEKVCKKIDFWIANLIEKNKKICDTIYSQLYIHGLINIYIVIVLYSFLYIEKEREKCWR